MKETLIPVIIPHYRKVHQLDKCIKHLRGQIVPVEIFVRDNKDSNKEIELTKINDTLYFAAKWLNGNFFRKLAFEGDKMDRENIDQSMRELALAKQILLQGN